MNPKTVASSLVLALMTGTLQAQVLDEIVVTAQKREQNLQDVGISVSAFSGDQMKALGVTNTIEITEQVPGLQVTTFSPNLVTFNIRGVSQNNFTDNNEAPVAVYIDDAYMASMNGISGQLFDIERVEVLRGPQGTLFGRNATGGVIQYVTKGADSDESNGYVEVGAGDFGRFNVEGAVGGAFSDTARYRFAARVEQSDGFIDSAPFPEGNPLPPSGESLGGADGYALRAAFQFDIGDDSLLDLRVKYSRDDEVPTGGYSFLPYGDNTQAYIPPEFTDFVTNVIGAPAAATPDIFFCPSQLDCFAPVDEAGRTIFFGDHPTPHLHFSDYVGFMDRDTLNLTARFDTEFDNGITFTSISNYSTVDKFYTEDGDGIPVPIIEFTTVADFVSFSEELRFAKENENSRWQVGLYYLNMEIEADVITRGAPVSGEAVGLGLDPGMLTDPAVVQDYTLDSRNWSVFGQGEWDISDNLTFIAGLRWSQDDKDLRFATTFQSPSDGITGIDLFDLNAAAAAANSDRDTVDYGDWAGRIQLDWRTSDDTLVFASFNRGIKGGNFAPSANVRLNNVRHEEEVLHAFEVGVKTELADGKARLNATAFYYDYDDYQAFTFSDGTPSISNADATNLGAEIELFLLPTENWDIILGASYQNSEVDNVETPQQQVTPVGFSVDWPIDFLNGVELPNAPTFNLNYLFRYNWDVSNGNVAIQFDGAYYDDQFYEVTNGGAAFQEAYNVSNFSVTWSNDEWKLTGWLKNAFDEEYKIYGLDLGILGGTAVYAPPAWYGFTAAYSF